MKRKRRWWLWLVLAFACMVIVITVVKLTGSSIPSVLGLGTLGVLGFLAAGLLLALATIFIIAPIVMLTRVLLADLISNKEIVYITLGGLGFSAILAGWILTIRQVEWSLLVIVGGFAFGCVAGVEYHEHSLSKSSESARILEQVPDEEDEDI